MTEEQSFFMQIDEVTVEECVLYLEITHPFYSIYEQAIILFFIEQMPFPEAL